MTCGSTVTSPTARSRSSTARRSWSWHRAALAISVEVLRRVYVGKGERRLRPIRTAGRPETIASTLRDLGRLAAAGPVAALDAATYTRFAAGARLAVSLGSVSGDGWGGTSSRTG
jgi:hypothetical protein